MTYELLMRRNSGPSPEGIQLTRDLMSRYERLFAGHLGDSFVPALTRRLAGDEIANWLHIPHSRWDRFVHSDRFDRFLPTAETRILARSPWTPA